MRIDIRNCSLIVMFTLIELNTIKLAWADGELDRLFYSSRQWVEYSQDAPGCRWYQPYPDTSIYNHVYFSGDLPGIGYPYHKSLIKGVNDTLEVSINFVNNQPNKAYSLDGKDVAEWFAPRVLQLFVVDADGPVFRDASQLGYRLRGWYSRIGPTPPPNEIPVASIDYIAQFDIWDLPEGRYQICFAPTDSVPADFYGISGGYVFEFYQAQSVSDTINAYEACFLRAMKDTNFTAAELWTDSILALDENSVVGLTLRARSSLAQGDTSDAINSYDKAIDRLENNTDPLLPDSTARPLSGAEQNYLKWLHVMLNHNREVLGP